MLSSTMVSVLAPHWSGGRLWRTKKGSAADHTDVPGNSQAVTCVENDETNCGQEQGPEGQRRDGVERWLRTRSQTQERGSLSGTRMDTAGCSLGSKSLSQSLDYGSKRTVFQSVPLDAGLGKLDNRKVKGGSFNPAATTEPPLSPLSPDQHAHWRMSQASCQGELSPSGSKPTTSSLLLSLRRLNSNWRKSSLSPSLSETNPLSLSSPVCDRAAETSMSHLSPISPNNNKRQTPNSLSHREGHVPNTRTLPTSARSEDGLLSPHLSQTTSRNYLTHLCPSKQSFLTSSRSERQQNCVNTDKTTGPLSDCSLPSSRLSQYDRSAFIKSRTLRRGTTLRCISWWKQETQEGSSPPSPNNMTNFINNNNNTVTPFFPDGNYNNSLAPTNHINDKRLSTQIPNDRDNNNTAESHDKGNLNMAFKTKGGAGAPRQSNAQESPGHWSDAPHESSLNGRDQQKAHSLPGISFSCKFSTAAGHTTLNDPKDHSVSNKSFKVNVSKLPYSSLRPKSLNTPTTSTSNHNQAKARDKASLLLESKSMEQDMQAHLKFSAGISQSTSEKNNITANTHPSLATFISPPITNLTAVNLPLSKNALTTEQNENKSFSLSKQSLPLDAANTHNCPSLSRKAISSPRVNPDSRSISYSNIQLPSSQTRIPALSSSDSTPRPRTPPQLLGFERTYASVPKSLGQKPAATFLPTPHIFYKTHHIALTPSSSALPSFSVSTASTPDYSHYSPPVTRALTSPTMTTVIPSSLLTPPATPTLSRSLSPKVSLPSQGEKTFSSTLELSPKKPSPKAEGKRGKQVRWQDSVDQENIKVKKMEPLPNPKASTSPLSLSKQLQSVRAPSIFSFHSPSVTESPLSPLTPKTSDVQLRQEEMSQTSLSRDGERDADCPSQFSFDLGGRDSSTAHHGSKLSKESSSACFRSSTALSLPPDFVSGYKCRYSSPPYSTLKSTQMTQGEAKNTGSASSPVFKQMSSAPGPPATSPPSLHPDPKTVSLRSSLSPLDICSNELLQLPFQNSTVLQEKPTFAVSEIDQVNKIKCKQSKTLDSPPTCVNVIETLVYRISKADSADIPDHAVCKAEMQKTSDRKVSVETQLHTVGSEVVGNAHSHSYQISNGSRSKEGQCSSTILTDDKQSNRTMREYESTFSALESKNEISPFQSSKERPFAKNKGLTAPNAIFSTNQEAQSDTETGQKSSNRMDQVLIRGRPSLSGKLSKDDLLFSKRGTQTPQTPSVSGSSDFSNVTVESGTTLVEEREQEKEKEEVWRDRLSGTEERKRWTENRYTLIEPKTVENKMAGDHFPIWPDRKTTESNRIKQDFEKDESRIQTGLTHRSPARHQFDFYKGDREDYRATSQPQQKDVSPARQQFFSYNQSKMPPVQKRNSTASPRSPLSSPPHLSPADDTDDSVFYSPKIHRRSKSSSLCKPGEEVRLAVSRGRKLSAGSPNGSPCQDKDRLVSYSNYADLKYGIEAGRSFSVSSVISSRPSGPGRISTGSRIMSVSDAFDPAQVSAGSTPSGPDRYPTKGDRMPNNHWQSVDDYGATRKFRVSSGPNDPGKLRSRSLPRSMTRSLSCWASEVPSPSPVHTAETKPGHLWIPTNMETSDDAEPLPTPPPTPPSSPPRSSASRRMSKPPSLPSYSSPGSPTSPQDSQSPRGHLPSRAFVCSLEAFEESSDSSSDTTTDDEYYLETGDDEEKETEL